MFVYLRSNLFVYKIYDVKTIEVGVYIDRHLYKNMEEVLFLQVSNSLESVPYLVS